MPRRKTSTSEPQTGTEFLPDRALGSTLLIVESPSKARTLASYLGAGYQVQASRGHVRDLPPKALGVDLDHDFAPEYRLVRGVGDVLKRLRAAIAVADTVVLATDPDREGEAIAWHVHETCRAALRGRRVVRATFHEITPSAVRTALGQPRDLDTRLVEAQQARRILDRIVGYKVSPVLWRAVRGAPGLSAGRVQSAALRLVVERDREIDAFVPREYWTLDAELSPVSGGAHFLARLVRIGEPGAAKDHKETRGSGPVHEPSSPPMEPYLPTQASVQAIVDALDGAEWKVAGVRHERRERRPFPPYTTSTLQRDAATRLHWPAKKTMEIAQQLYEGVALPGMGRTGLITYMRTDSTQVAESAQAAARQVIAVQFGLQVLPHRPPVYRTKVANAQEAHEAIRPTDPERLPDVLHPALTSDQARLYELIWRRFLASQMKPAVYAVTLVDVDTSRGATPLPYHFRASARRLVEPGFLVVYGVEDETDQSTGDGLANASLPPLQAGDPLTCHRLIPEQHFTEPPPHYTEAGLIRSLESQGIGRPSTYAGITATLLDRGYVERRRTSLASTPLGRLVSDLLTERFPDVFAIPFTADMEQKLDDIANGQMTRTAVLREFWDRLRPRVDQAMSEVQPVTIPGGTGAARSSSSGRAGQAAKRRAQKPPTAEDEPVLQWLPGKPEKSTRRARRLRSTDNSGSIAGRRRKATSADAPDVHKSKSEPVPMGETCPECGKPLVQRTGPYGAFIGCSGFPRCRYKPPKERPARR